MYKITFLLATLLLLVGVASCKSVAISQQKNTEIDGAAQRKQDSLAFELCQIYGLDQGIRNDFLKQEHIDFGNVYQAIDTLNFDRIITFIERNGYPNKQLLGEKNYSFESVQSVAGVVLLHNPHRLVNEQKYYDLFLNEVKRGNLKPESLALVLDKYYWGKSKNKTTRRVFYGSQFGKPCVQTKEATNKARIEIGLEALEEGGFVDCGDGILDMPKERT
jgi:hypothetical protein